jgi:hypothetical protein
LIRIEYPSKSWRIIADLRGGILPGDLLQQLRIGVVGFREDVVVERGQGRGQNDRQPQARGDDPKEVDSARAESGDLVVLTHASIGHEDGDQDAARHGEGDHPTERQKEQARDGHDVDPLADEEIEQVEEHLHREQEGDESEPEEERSDQARQDVSTKDQVRDLLQPGDLAALMSSVGRESWWSRVRNSQRFDECRYPAGMIPVREPRVYYSLSREPLPRAGV